MSAKDLVQVRRSTVLADVRRARSSCRPCRPTTVRAVRTAGAVGERRVTRVGATYEAIGSYVDGNGVGWVVSDNGCSFLDLCGASAWNNRFQATQRVQRYPQVSTPFGESDVSFTGKTEDEVKVSVDHYAASHSPESSGSPGSSGGAVSGPGPGSGSGGLGKRPGTGSGSPTGGPTASASEGSSSLLVAGVFFAVAVGVVLFL